jgi:hypothetical protein
VTDQGTQFTSNLVKAVTEQYQIKHRKSTPYHPQANGQVESTNKVIESILTKTVQLHHKDWANRLLEALWAYRITWRNTIGHTPYELVYGKQVLLPIEFQIKTFRIVVQVGMNLDEPNNKDSCSLMNWMKLGRKHFKELPSFKNREQNGMTSISKKKKFQQGDWALLYDNRFKKFKGKLTTHWMGPYKIDIVYDNVSIRINTIDEQQTPLLMNGHRL